MHNDFEGKIVAVKGDVFRGFREVGGQIARSVDAGLLQEDAERAAFLGIAQNADTCHAEGLSAEGIGAIVAQVAAVRVSLRFDLASGDVGGAKYLEGFEESRQRNLEARIFGVVFVIGLGRVKGVIGEQRLAQACDAYCWSATCWKEPAGWRSNAPCITRDWSAENLTVSSPISTWTLLVKAMHLRSCWMGLVELATARKMGAAWVGLGVGMINSEGSCRIKKERRWRSYTGIKEGVL